MGIGKVVGAVFKGVGWVCNEIFKEASGIDIKELASPLAETYKEGENISKEIKEFEANKEAFIKEYGVDEYNSELEYLRDNYKMAAKNLRDNYKMAVEDFKYDLKDMIDEREEKYEDMVKKKIAKMPDEQILYVLNKKEVSPQMYKLLEQERIARRI